MWLRMEKIRRSSTGRRICRPRCCGAVFRTAELLVEELVEEVGAKEEATPGPSSTSGVGEEEQWQQRQPRGKG